MKTAGGSHSVVLLPHDEDVMRADGVAIVIGGSHGAGRELTRRLTRAGFAVVVAYTDDREGADAVVDEILAANGNALTVRADPADALDLERLFAETIEWFGRVDVVVRADRLTRPSTEKEHRMDVATLADLLRETSEHHDPYEKSAPEHNWWDWYAAYMDARQRGSTPDEASDAARCYMDGILPAPPP